MQASAIAEEGPGATPSGWLRAPAFDLVLIGGVLLLALLLGGAAALDPTLFDAVLFVDVWFLAYPHVASTFTRIAFDKTSVRSHRFLLFAVPPLVLFATAGAAWLGGAALLNTVYFYWQSYHYTRQSYGIARAYRRAAGGARGRDWLTDVVVLAFPVWGVLHRAEQRQPAFFGAPLWSPPVPKVLVTIAGGVALLAFAAWALRQVRSLRAGGPPVLGSTLFVLSHVGITAVSYLAISEITRGWLFINLWHNAQYLLFVWAANARRFSKGVEPSRPFLSWLSQPAHAGWYAAVCIGLSGVFYLALGQTTSRFSQEVLPVILICHQAVNFYHYVVDAVIWRTPRGTASRRSGAQLRSSIPRS
jgi:hypothetical protein